MKTTNGELRVTAMYVEAGWPGTEHERRIAEICRQWLAANPPDSEELITAEDENRKMSSGECEVFFDGNGNVCVSDGDSFACLRGVKTRGQLRHLLVALGIPASK